MSQSSLSDPPSDVEAYNPDTTVTSTSSTNSHSLPKKGLKRPASSDPASFEDSPSDSKRRTKRARISAGPVAHIEEDEGVVIDESAIVKILPTKTKRIPKRKAKESAAEEVEGEVKEEEEEEEGQSVRGESVKKVGKKTKKKSEVHSDDGVTKKKAVRKTKAEREAEAEAKAMPLAARTFGSKIVIGAHVSSAGGVHRAIKNSVHIGGNAFALFLKSQRKWTNPPLVDEHCTQFLSNCKEHKYDTLTQNILPIVPHGSYLVNLAHPAPDRTKQAYDCFLDDLDRCRKLGIRWYNFHPGNSAANTDRLDGLKHVAAQLNKAHKDSSSGNVVTLLETMATAGNVLGSTFEDLASIIHHVDDKDRVGVCLDTCHVFAAGYDIRTPEAYGKTMSKFNDIIGLNYLKAFHINDSKAPLGSERDLHANIGTGFLGLRSFHNIVNDSRLWGLPMVLETPISVKDDDTGKEISDQGIWAREIKLLESLVGMNVGSKEFLALEKELSERGKAERERVQDQVDRREEKKTMKGKKDAGKRKLAGDRSSEDSE